MKAVGVRVVVLAALAAAAGIVWLIASRAEPGRDVSRLTWIADAHQFGPVGYRDPAGAISPDGRWIAYSEGRFLRVRDCDGPDEAAGQRDPYDGSSARGGHAGTASAKYDSPCKLRASALRISARA